MPPAHPWARSEGAWHPTHPPAASASTCEALGVNDDPLHWVRAALFFFLLQAQGDLLGRVLEGTGEGSGQRVVLSHWLGPLMGKAAWSEGPFQGRGALMGQSRSLCLKVALGRGHSGEAGWRSGCT